MKPKPILALVALLAAPVLPAQTPAGAPKQQAQRPKPLLRNMAPPAGPTKFGDPLPGLPSALLTAFDAGRQEFQNTETPDGGLGPIFNNNSCVSCHSSPASGGSSSTNVFRFGHRAPDGSFDPLAALGGSLLQQFAIDAAVREIIPPQANVVAQRQSTPLFGLGLIEAIPATDIIAQTLRPGPDGIRGRVSWVDDVTTGQKMVGRFGWKAQQATLLAFSGDAYLNEMGITSRFFPQENAPNGNVALLAQYDRFADPEDEIDPATGKSDIDMAADFMRLLAPPPPVRPGPAAENGRMTFQTIGCAACHRPSFTTGPSPVAAFDRKPVPLFSDLLLHDMGALGDGIVQGSAGARDLKTPPLWGVRASAPYLHDGRAPSLDAAIRAHDGEGAPSRQRYLSLPPRAQQDLAEFLKTL